MKKKVLAMVMCLGTILSLAGCNKEPEAPQPIPAEPSTWELVSEDKFVFSSYLVGYYDDDSAASMGYNGEVHYYDPAEKSWPFSENKSLCRYGMDMVNENIIYTCGNGGHVTKSVDGGKTYTKMTSFAADASDQGVMMSFCDENNGLVASVSQLAITADGANTWTDIAVPSGLLAIRMESPEKFCYIGSDLNFYKTADGGATWESAPMNLPLGDGYRTDMRNNFVFTIDGENMYTVFCIENENLSLKSYSTADGWLSCTENTVPEITGMKKGYLYMNRDGSIMTVTNVTRKRICPIRKAAAPVAE